MPAGRRSRLTIAPIALTRLALGGVQLVVVELGGPGYDDDRRGRGRERGRHDRHACNLSRADTTMALEQRAMAFTQPGPYPVGVTTVDADGLPGGQQIEVWYPAAEGTSGTVSYDVRDYTPEALRKLFTADVPATVTIDAERDAAAADGTFPLVLFSHGYAGIRVQSSFLTSHLASWGIVVASPEPSSRDLAAVTSGQATNGNGTDDPSVADLQRTLAKMAEQNRIEGPLESHIDLDHVYAVGHSAGGATVLNAAATMPEIKGYVSLASAVGLAPPDKPSLFIAGADDGVVSVDDITRPTFEAAPRRRASG